MTDLAATVARLVAPLHRCVMLAVGRAVLRAAAAGGTRLQVTLLADETRDGVERLQDYGLASTPRAGAEVVVLCLGGNRDRPIAVVVSDASGRPSLAEGEVALHSHQGAHWVHLKAGGEIELRAATKVTVVAPLVEVPSGDVTAGGVSLRQHRHGGGPMPDGGGP